MIDQLSKDISDEYQRRHGKSVESYYINTTIRTITLLILFLAVGVMIGLATSKWIAMPIIILGMMIGFLPLRKMFGGLHFRSNVVCFFATTLEAAIIGLLSLYSNNELRIHIVSVVSIYCLAGLCFVVIGVIDSEENPLEKLELEGLKILGFRVYRIIILIQVVTSLLNRILGYAIAFGVLFVTIDLILGFALKKIKY